MIAHDHDVLALSVRASGSPLWVIVEEVLGGILSPTRLDEVVSEALELAGRSTVPQDGNELLLLIDGSLFAALARHLDIADATEVTSQIRAALAIALADDPPPTISDVRSVRRRRQDLLRPERVVVVSRASLVTFMLEDVLGPRVEVTAVSSEAALRDALRAPSPALVVVDRKHPRATLDADPVISKELGPGSRVLLWGGRVEDAEWLVDALGRGPTAPVVEHLGFEVMLADLADRVRALIHR